MKRLLLLFFALHLYAAHEEEKAFFQQHGYLWVKGFFSSEQVAMLRAWADTMNDAAETLLSISQSSPFSLQMLAQRLPLTLIVVPEAKDPLKVCRVEDMLTCYPEFHHFIAGTVTAFVSALMDEPYVLFKDKTNFKWPGGGAFPPHQDFPAYEFFGPRSHITAMVCIDSASLENGCLHIADNWSGDDATSVLPYIVGGPGHGSIQPEYVQKIVWKPVEAQAGDVLFFTSYLPHYSEPNRSNQPRRAMFFTHNRLRDGDHRDAYYHVKREDPDNPVFHFATPTKARTK